MLHADLTLLLHTYQVADGACFLVYRLHALHAGTALVIAYLCYRRDRLPLWRTGLPLLLSTCVATGLPTHASFHVNVYALITPPPWSILSLFQPPLQRSPSVVTVITLASTYCSFPVCGDRQEFRESPFVRPERASLSFAFLLSLPPLWRAARPRSESSVGDPVIICLLFHLPTFMARGPSGPAYYCLSAQFAPVMARGPVLGASAQ